MCSYQVGNSLIWPLFSVHPFSIAWLCPALGQTSTKYKHRPHRVPERRNSAVCPAALNVNKSRNSFKKENYTIINMGRKLFAGRMYACLELRAGLSDRRITLQLWGISTVHKQLPINGLKRTHNKTNWNYYVLHCCLRLPVVHSRRVN